MAKTKTKKKLPLPVKLLVWLAVAVVVIALAIAGFYYIKLMGTTDKSVDVVEKTPGPAAATPLPEPSLEPVEGDPDDLDVDYDDAIDDGQVGQDAIYNPDIIDEDVVNILLLGEDTLPGDSGGRSDTMMLLSYNRETGEAKLVSFLRDTYVFIPGRNTWNRINAAYRYGGIGLTINTINETFGLDIRYYVITDFVKMVNMVDKLGGLTVHLTRKEAVRINEVVPGSTLPEEEGDYLLMGDQVLAQCRNRHTGDGDWGRTQRQRQVMLAFFHRAKQETSIPTLAALTTQLLDYVTTNMPPNMLIQLGAEAVFSKGFDMKSGHVPFDGTWHYARVNGASVIKIDAEDNKEQLHEFLYGAQ